MRVTGEGRLPFSSLSADFAWQRSEHWQVEAEIAVFSVSQKMVVADAERKQTAILFCRAADDLNFFAAKPKQILGSFFCSPESLSHEFNGTLLDETLFFVALTWGNRLGIELETSRMITIQTSIPRNSDLRIAS